MISNENTVRLSNWLCAASVAVGSAALIWAIAGPVESAAEATVVSARGGRAAQSGKQTNGADTSRLDSGSSTPASTMSRIDWSRPLQGRRVAGEAAQSIDAADVGLPTNDTLGLRLIGTMIEPPHDRAMLADQYGGVDIQQAGQPLRLQPAGIRLVAVESDHAVIEYQGRRTSLSFSQTVEPTAVDNALRPPAEASSYTGSASAFSESTMANTPSPTILDGSFETELDPSTTQQESEGLSPLEQELERLNGTLPLPGSMRSGKMPEPASQNDSLPQGSPQ